MALKRVALEIGMGQRVHHPGISLSRERANFVAVRPAMPGIRRAWFPL